MQRARREELCPAYQQAKLSTNEAELIVSGLPFAVWVYESGIIGDGDFSAFDTMTLNSFGIYTDGTFSSITNPTLPLYIFAGANVEVNLDGGNSAIINAHGTSVVNINMENDSHTEVKCYGNTHVSINLVDNASLAMEAKALATVNIGAYNQSVVHIVSNGFSQVTITAGGTTFCKGRFYQNSQLTYTPIASAENEFQFFNNAFLTNPV